MIVSPENRPFRFYNDDDKDKYGYKIPNTDIEIVKDVYKQYITELIKAYSDLGGDISSLQKGGFIRIENGEISVDIDKIIEDCKVFDEKMVSTDDNVEGSIDKFSEASYGLNGFLERYTDIDKEGKLTHQDVAKKAIESLSSKNDRTSNSNKIAFAFAAVEDYWTRSTIMTASQMVADGAMMQIGCSQGKTSVLAIASYIDMMQDKRVMNTSSNPGLVLGNFKEFIKVYDYLGVSDKMCAITRDSDGKDIIMTREKITEDLNLTIKINENGEISFPEIKAPVPPVMKENPTDEDKKLYDKQMKKYNKNKVEYDKLVEKISKIIPGFSELDEKNKTLKMREYLGKSEKFREKYGEQSKGKTFEDRVRETLRDKPIVMADTMTLLKYERCMDALERDESGAIKDSICMCDEADCEFLDARPYEILGKKYSDKAQQKRFELRRQADSIIEAELSDGKTLSSEELKQLSVDKNVPLEFLIDAYDVRTSMSKENEEYVIDTKTGEISTINANKRVLEKDTQGHQQAIYAMRANQGKVDEIPREREVLDVKYPYQVIGLYETHSLISGTMEDKGLSTYKGDAEGLYREFTKVREKLFASMGFRTPVSSDVINFRTVGPLAREDKGMVMSVTEGIDLQVDEKEKIEPYKKFSLEGMSWKDYVESNRESLEKQWAEEIKSELDRRKGKPVLVSVLDQEQGDSLQRKLGIAEENIQTYTDVHKPDEKMKKNGKMSFKIGQVYFMDDAYGRGYNSDFESNDGHVLITTLPNNSRNLEQFLFRVARGSNKGSSSMIISPTDPKLVEFLEKVDNNGEHYLEQFKSLFSEEELKSFRKEDGSIQGLSDAYFTKLMQGEIKLDRLIFDMYPEKTMEILQNMANKNDFISKTQSSIAKKIEFLKTSGISEENISYIETALNKSRASHIKTYSGEDIDQEFIEIQKEATSNVMLALASKGKVISEEEFSLLMPEGLSEQELKRTYEALRKKSEKIKSQKQPTKDESEKVKEDESEKVNADGSKKVMGDEIKQAIADYELEAKDVLTAVKDAREINGRDEEEIGDK